ncbi:hypothetical protein [Nitrospira sp. Nam80]
MNGVKGAKTDSGELYEYTNRGEAVDGLETVKLAEEFRPCPAMTVIGLSVQKSAQVESIMKAAGASEYLTKDMADEQLYRAVILALERHPSRVGTGDAG